MAQRRRDNMTDEPDIAVIGYAKDDEVVAVFVHYERAR
jgi:hypothetical protein